MAPANVVVFGSIIEDLTSYTERFPRPGETVFGTGFLSSGGGKGANQAVAAARLGAHVMLLAKVRWVPTILLIYLLFYYS
ncbi:unnamed protein product [Nippostrongylus brasiliensis]|uniref:Ribokinase (inferred by orthology to a human protein) n=1 Tax=Nippostrongylus brasiliensis TaxID=27835 RepID=A0A0N4XPD1_NIPBR|nr:unnamed protein product [Nippostrongylus brasiliensis]